jgi:hypothetical protein
MAAVTTAASRAREAARSAWPGGAPEYALLALVLAGVALRIVAAASWWPVTDTLGDSYEFYVTDPFSNPVHPAGYPLILAAIGAVTREIAVTVLLQHLSAVAAALLLWAATRRLTASDWAGLLPAGIVLLDPDFIFLEHSLMSESWFVLAVSAGLYAATRALEQPAPDWRWPLIAGLALSAAVTIRTAALPLIAVAALAALLWRPWASEDRPLYMRSALTILGASAVILLLFATANALFGARFGLGASPGWYLYARAAQFADCDEFTPPEGTEPLCERRPPSERPGTRYYSFEPTAPAPAHFGAFGSADGSLGTWARRAILAQPGDYLSNVWQNLRGYWLPDLRPKDSTGPSDPWMVDEGLDPQLAFTNALAGSGLFQPKPGDSGSSVDRALAFSRAIYRHNLARYYDPFQVHIHRGGLEFLRGWQRVVRFGGAALTIATILVLIGLLIGDRRSRVGVLLFGVGGLSLLLVPGLTANYWGRYTVPMAGPMLTAVAITIVALLSRRRTAP